MPSLRTRCHQPLSFDQHPRRLADPTEQPSHRTSSLRPCVPAGVDRTEQREQCIGLLACRSRRGLKPGKRRRIALAPDAQLQHRSGQIEPRISALRPRAALAMRPARAIAAGKCPAASARRHLSADRRTPHEIGHRLPGSPCSTMRIEAERPRPARIDDRGLAHPRSSAGNATFVRHDLRRPIGPSTLHPAFPRRQVAAKLKHGQFTRRRQRLQPPGGLPDLAQSRQKDEHVARRLIPENAASPHRPSARPTGDCCRGSSR